MPDVLHIVIVIEEVQHLFHVGDVLFLLQLLVILGDHLDLGGGEMVALGGEGVGHGVEVVGGGVDGEAVLLGLEVIGAGIHSVHHDRVFLIIPVLVVNDQDALPVKGPGDAAGGAHVAAVLVEVVAHGACGTVAVIGHGLHNHGHAAGAVTLVGDGLVIVAGAGAAGLLQHPLDVVLIVGLYSFAT